MISRSLKRNGWRASDLILATALPLLGIVATWPVWFDIYRVAFYSDEQAHIFLVPFIAAWLVWVRRDRFHGLGRTGTAIGPMLIIAGWVLMSVGPRFDFESVVHLGAVVLVIGCLVGAIGAEPVKLFFPAFFVLMFFVPVPGVARDYLIAPIQSLAVTVPNTLLDALGMPVTTNGELMLINGQAIGVNDLFEGTFMLMTVMLLSLAFGFGLPLRPRVRALVIGISPLAAIVLNVIRMFFCELAYGTMPMFVAVFVHVVSGWVVITAAIVLLLWIIRLMRRARLPVTRFTLAYD